MLNKFYNKLSSAIPALLLAVSASPSVASEIDTIDIKVELDTLGTAHVKEHWVVDVDDSNTEWYLSMKNFGEMVITGFKVYDNDQHYYLESDTPWDVDRTRAEKAGKCGIHEIFEGNELCWGVGSSGHHSWTAEYKIEGFVKKYQDGCGFNHCFINHDLSSDSKFTRTTISMADSTPLSFNNSRIWAFQYNGTCKFVEGRIVSQNTESFTTSNSMIVMCLFPVDMFQSTNIVNDTIGTMKWKALEGSDYLENYTEEDYEQGKNVFSGDMAWWEWLGIGVFMLLVTGIYYLAYAAFALSFYYGLILFWNVVSLRPLRIYLRQKKLLEGGEKYFTGTPIKGDLNRAFHILDDNNYRVFPKDKDELFAAYIVRLMRYKAITIVNTIENGKSVNRMKIAENWHYKSENDSSSTELSIKENPNDDQTEYTGNADEKCMQLMYKILRKASGDNHILEKGELKAYLKKYTSEGKKLLKAAEKENKEDATPREYQEIIGLKNYLKDFSMIDSRGAVEVELWDEYLVYATLFGMADQVIKDFKKYAPDYFTTSFIGRQLIDESGSVVSDFYSFTGVSSVSRGMSSGSPASTSSSGGGGFSSSGGGGGCSGGGGGGGR